jgi:hypothetical protein
MSIIYINPYTFAAPTSGIITDGLQLYLDAGNASSYPSSGTTWTDLSGNGRNGTLTPTVGGPGFDSANGGSITFDGSNDYVLCTGSISATGTSLATFIVWMNRGGADQYDGILFSRGATSTSTSGMHYQNAANLAYTWNDASNTYNWGSGLTVPQAWCMCVITVTSTVATAYIYQAGNSITSATNTVSHGDSTLNSIRVGYDSATRYYQGKIAQALIYNRALTQAELTANYNVDKARYGL